MPNVFAVFCTPRSCQNFGVHSREPVASLLPEFDQIPAAPVLPRTWQHVSDGGAHSGDACCGGSRFGTNFGSLSGLWYLQIWDKLLQSQPAVFIPVQCEQTVSSFALEALDALHASINLLCQKIWTSLGSLSGRLSYLCSADRWSASVLVRQRARTMYQQIWDELLSGLFKPVQCVQMVSSSALDTTSAFGSVTCRQIWDQFWQSQRALLIPVQRGQMVRSSALERAPVGSVICRQISDELWQSQRAVLTLVQYEQMMGWCVVARDARSRALKITCAKPGIMSSDISTPSASLGGSTIAAAKCDLEFAGWGGCNWII